MALGQKPPLRADTEPQLSTNLRWSPYQSSKEQLIAHIHDLEAKLAKARDHNETQKRRGSLGDERTK